MESIATHLLLKLIGLNKTYIIFKNIQLLESKLLDKISFYTIFIYVIYIFKNGFALVVFFFSDMQTKMLHNIRCRITTVAQYCEQS